MIEERALTREQTWLMILRIAAGMMLIFIVVSFIRFEWPYPLKALYSVLLSMKKIDDPLLLALFASVMILFAVIMNPLAVYSLFMYPSRFVNNAGRVGQVLWAADVIICVCRCMGGNAVPGVTRREIFLDILCICLTSAVFFLRRKNDEYEEGLEKTEEEKESGRRFRRRHSIVLIVVFCTLFFLLSLCALILYSMFGLDGYLIDNPVNEVISERYKGWYRVPLGEEHGILLPEEWELAEEDGFLYIVDRTGRKAAIGKQFQERPATEEVNEMLSVYFGKDVTGQRDFEGAGSQRLLGGDCEWYEVTAAFADGQEQNVITMGLGYSFGTDEQYMYYFCFGNPDEELYTKASAMIYSFDK